MNRLLFLLVATSFVPSVTSAALRVWDGGGDGKSWSDGANWSGDVRPAAGDDVVIDVAGTNATITGDLGSTLTLRSLQCEEALSVSSGGITLTNGASWVRGGFTLGGKMTLVVKGASTSFTADGTTAINGANLHVQDGAQVSLPALYSYTDNGSCCGATLEVNGAGSMLDLSSLTNLTGNPTWAMSLRAVAGGALVCSNLAWIQPSFIAVYADGTNSVIRLPVLTTFPGTSGRLTFEVRNAAAIELPLFTVAQRVDFVLRSGGELALSQFATISQGGVTVDDGSAVEFSVLTNLNGTSLAVSGGSVLRFPALVSYTDNAGCCGATLAATGAGSVLDLSSLTDLTGNPTWAMSLRAVAGGAILCSNLAWIQPGFTAVYADGTNSVIRLPVLTTFPGTSGRLAFEVRNAGAIELPLFTVAQRVEFVLRSGGQFPLSQFTTISLGGVTVDDGSAVEFSVLTNLNGTSLAVSGGSVLRFPALVSYTDDAGCCGAGWRASGDGSSLEFPLLTSLTGNPTWSMVVQASTGGRIELPSLVYIPNSVLTLKAIDAGSAVNVPILSQFQGTAGLLALDAGSGGVITSSNLLSGVRVAFARRSGGSLPVEQITTLSLGSLTLEDGVSATFNTLTNVDGAAFSVASGSRAVLPAVTAFADTSGCCGTSWQASGSNTLLSLPALAFFAGNPTWAMTVSALAGGTVDLGGVVTVSPSVASLKADGTNSLINLSSLTTVSGSSGQLSMEAKNGGTILIGNLVDGQRAGLVFRSGGTMVAPLVSRLLNLTVDAVAVDLPAVTNLTATGTLTLQNAGSLTLAGVTNLDGQSLSVSGGSTLSLPGVRSYRDTSGCCGASWSATGSNSTLSLPGLTNLVGNPTWAMVLQSLAGGKLDLSQIRTFGDGHLRVLADGTNSLVDLESFEAFTPTGGSLALDAQNTGRIDLGTNATTLSRTTITIRTNSTVAGGWLTLDSGSLLTGAGTLSASLENLAEVRPTGCGLTIAGEYACGPGSLLTLAASTPGTNTGLSALVVTGQVALAGSVGLTGPINESLGNVYVVLSNTGPSAIAGTFDNVGTLLGGSEGSFHCFVNVGDGNDVMLVRPFITLEATNGLPVVIRAVAHDYAVGYPLQLLPGARRLSGVGAPGVTANLEASTNLTDWFPIASGLSDTNGLVQFQDADLLPSRFYRLDLP